MAGDNTYDFSGVSSPSTTHIAYQGTDSNQPPTGPNPDIGIQLYNDEYNKIALSDDTRDMEGDDAFSDFHRFKFKIDDLVNTITQIY